MLVSKLKIENFRGIKSANINLGRHTVLIGGNNCGKTTIIEALTLLLGRDKMIRSLTEHDFYGSEPKITDRIRLIATLSEFPSELPEENPDWFGDGRAIPKWLNTKTYEVNALQQGESSRLACEIAFSARFDFQTLEVETLRYFFDDTDIGDVFADETFVRLPSKIIKDLGFFIIPASRSWDKVISFGSELFKRVIVASGGKPANSIVEIRDKLRMPDAPIEEDVNLSALVGNINEELAHFFSNNPKLKLRLTSTDSEGILDTVIPHFGQAGINISLPSKRHGSGLISLQWLLLLLEFGRQRAKAGEGFVMALEEPELHIPPFIQSKLVHRIQALSTQTFITTHSPTVASMADPCSLLILNNKSGELKAKLLLDQPLPSNSPNSIRSLFQLNRMSTVSALMNDYVLIPEGRTDFDLLTLLVNAVELKQQWKDNDLTTIGTSVGIIVTHDAAVKTTFDAIKDLHPSVHCIVDGDNAGRQYADDIIALNQQNTKVLQWAQNWTIENVIGWILEADSVNALRIIKQNFEVAPISIQELVVWLQTETKKPNGLKGDRLAYDTLFQIVIDVDACCLRATSLLSDLYSVFLNKPTLYFKQNSLSPNLFIFNI
jgi:putative ATP-dependent endonuclease of the OLD family